MTQSQLHTSVTPAYLDDLRAAVTAPGPFASLYVGIDEFTEDAAARMELEWRARRDELAEAGAPDEVLGILDERVPSIENQCRGLALIAGESGVAVEDDHLAPPSRQLARWGALPSFGELIRWRQGTPPHLVVLASRDGADFHAAGPGKVLDEALEGETPVAAKSKPGGWSQRRYQIRAEATWERNADEIVARIEQLDARFHPRVVVLAAGARELALMEERLPDTIWGHTRTIESNRDCGLDDVADDVIRQVATAAAEDLTQILAKLREELGQADAAVEGVAATVEALTQARVDILTVHDDPDDDRKAFFGPEPHHIALEVPTLLDMGVTDVTEYRLVDVMIRSALGTGADVRIIPKHGGPAEGVGALLRWGEPSE